MSGTNVSQMQAQMCDLLRAGSPSLTLPAFSATRSAERGRRGENTGMAQKLRCVSEDRRRCQGGVCIRRLGTTRTAHFLQPSLAR